MTNPQINKMDSALNPQEMRKIWQVLEKEAQKGQVSGDWKPVYTRCVLGLVLVGAAPDRVLELRIEDLDLIGRMRVAVPGTGESRRSYLLAGRLHWILMELLGYTVLHGDPNCATGQLFVTPTGDAVSSESLEDYLSCLVLRVGIDKQVSFKNIAKLPFRREFALKLLGGREEISRVARILKARKIPFGPRKQMGAKQEMGQKHQF